MTFSLRSHKTLFKWITKLGNNQILLTSPTDKYVLSFDSIISICKKTTPIIKKYIQFGNKSTQNILLKL